MCIYCGTRKYRKIYENHIGPIPKDSFGKTYDVHHIDRNRKNNHPDNLVALSTQDHYELHKSHGDWAACHRLAGKMKLSARELSELASLVQQKRVQDKTHPWLNKEEARRRANQRVQSGTHPFVGPNLNKMRVEAGTHHFLDGKVQKESNQRRVRNGTHHLLGGEIQRQGNLTRLAEGNHPSQVVCISPICQRTIHGKGNLTQHLRKCEKQTR